MTDQLEWMFNVNFENVNILSISIVFRGKHYLWMIKTPLRVSRW